MKVYMNPREKDFSKNDWNGIRMVVRYYEKYLTEIHGVEFVDDPRQADLVAMHAGARHASVDPNRIDVTHCHGLYWTEDFQSPVWEYKENAYVIRNIRGSRAVTVPSQWVATNITRDSRRPVTVVNHGIEYDAWQDDIDDLGYVIWNKNRASDACDPSPMYNLALARPDTLFMTTFLPPDAEPLPHIKVTGKLPHPEMMKAVKHCAVYLSTTKETFGIGILEAMAAGKPVLAYDEGGAAGIIEHGVTGYLAVPGDLGDLVNGLQFCLDNRAKLGRNARRVAQAYTWEAAVDKVYSLYTRILAEKSRPSTVSFVIPVYNYAHELPRAVASAVNQTIPPHEIVIVNDGSTDNTQEVADSLADQYPTVSVISQPNRGVAAARNAGIMSVDSEFIVCLDADDAVKPTFVETCLPEMTADNGLGIAYTGLHAVLPDGTEKISDWPGPFDYQSQIRGFNQVPTCCMFRKSMWEQLGGYKSRCAPGGAGFEDADFWLRCGAYGWKAKKVTDEPLFIYSLGSGRVSSMDRPALRRFEEALHDNIVTWYPWATDNLQPFMSLLEPASYSHPVRQYDRPDVTIIIPVGPGHELTVESSLDSIDAQTYRFWEAIVVWDTPAYDSHDVRRIKAAYPHMTHINTADHFPKPPAGAGAARNVGVDHASSTMITFLDADDWLFPTFIEETIDAYYTHQSAIYTDYMGKAAVDDVSRLADDLARNVKQHIDGIAVIEYKAADFDCDRALRQPEDPPWVWNNINTLFPRDWHYEIGGFDESMPSWEDVEYWYRMARYGKCFVRIPRPLMMYRFYTGRRRDSVFKAGQRWESLIQYIKWKMGEIGHMGCSGCRDKKVVTSPSMPVRAFSNDVQPAVSAMSADSDWMQCRFNSSNRGDQPVVLYREDGTKRKVMLAPGDKILVHVSDVNAIPGRFTPIAERSLPHRAPRPVGEIPSVSSRPVPKAPRVTYNDFIEGKVDIDQVEEERVKDGGEEGGEAGDGGEVVGPDGITLDEFLVKRNTEREAAYRKFREENPIVPEEEGEEEGDDASDDISSAVQDIPTDPPADPPPDPPRRRRVKRVVKK